MNYYLNVSNFGTPTTRDLIVSVIDVVVVSCCVDHHHHLFNVAAGCVMVCASLHSIFAWFEVLVLGRYRHLSRQKLLSPSFVLLRTHLLLTPTSRPNSNTRKQNLSRIQNGGLVKNYQFLHSEERGNLFSFSLNSNRSCCVEAALFCFLIPCLLLLCWRLWPRVALHCIALLAGFWILCLLLIASIAWAVAFFALVAANREPPPLLPPMELLLLIVVAGCGVYSNIFVFVIDLKSAHLVHKIIVLCQLYRDCPIFQRQRHWITSSATIPSFPNLLLRFAAVVRARRLRSREP